MSVYKNVKDKVMLSYLPRSIDTPFDHNVKSGFEVWGSRHVPWLKEMLCTYRWSPILWKDGIRLSANFIESHYLALDFEDPSISVEDIKRRLFDTWYIIGSTTNHQLPKGDKPSMDRFRVLIPWDRTIINLDQYKYNLDHYTRYYGADNQAKDGARSFVKCREILAENTSEDLYFETVLDLLPIRPRKRYPYVYGSMPRYTRWALQNHIPSGERSIAIWRMGKDLCSVGIDYEDALSRILASPTYLSSVISSETMRKIKSQLRSGYEEIEGKMRQ